MTRMVALIGLMHRDRLRAASVALNPWIVSRTLRALVEQFFQTFFTPLRFSILCGGFFICQLSYFLYIDSTSSLYNRQCGVREHDLFQFYLSGRIVANHESDKLYDNDFFLQKQFEITPYDEAYRLRRARYFSLYPPTMALVFAPLAGVVSYDAFFKIGRLWIIVGFFLATRWLIADLNPSSHWRRAAWIGAVSFHPTLTMYFFGQFGWLWLLILMSAFRLRRTGNQFLEGVCLSLLALKPQFAAAALLWVVLSRAWQTLSGFALGVAAQLLLVAVILGPTIWVNYLNSIGIYGKMHSLFQFNAEFQQSVPGIIQDLTGNEHLTIARILYLSILSCVLYFGFRISRGKSLDYRREEAATILLIVLAVPHLLIYDLVLLLIPIVHLFSLHRDHPKTYPVSIPAFLFLLPMAALLYPITPGFSLVPVATFTALYRLAFEDDTGSPLHSNAS